MPSSGAVWSEQPPPEASPRAAVTELPAACRDPTVLQTPASPDSAPGNTHVALECLKWEKGGVRMVRYTVRVTGYGCYITVKKLQKVKKEIQ